MSPELTTEKQKTNPFYKVKDIQKAIALAERAIDVDHYCYVMKGVKIITLNASDRNSAFLNGAIDFLVNEHGYKVEFGNRYEE